MAYSNYGNSGGGKNEVVVRVNTRTGEVTPVGSNHSSYNGSGTKKQYSPEQKKKYLQKKRSEKKKGWF